MRPVLDPTHEAVLYGIDITIFDMSFVVGVIADEVLPIAPLPEPRSPRAVRTVDLHSSLANDLEKCVLISRQRVAKSASSGGKVQTAWRWSGKMTIAAISNGNLYCVSLKVHRKIST